jgi:opine dehydrogenase
MLSVAIAGAGPVARASAVLLARRGHAAALWSPRGRGTATLEKTAPGRARLPYSGCIDGSVEVGILDDPSQFARHDVVLVAVPGNAYPAVLPRIVPHLQAAQTVIVSGALSLAPLWLYERSGPAAARPLLVSWGTTIATARLPDTSGVRINTLRTRFEAAALPESRGAEALAVCRALFGDRFTAAPLLATALLNVNPVAHAAEVLPNLTRIDRREDWSLFGCLTPAAARLGEAIDRERQEVARAYGLEVRSIHEHTHLSYHVPQGSYAEMAAAIDAAGGSPRGPVTLEHRYLLEDVPYGLVFYETLAAIAGVAVPHIGAAITLLSTASGHDFRNENALLRELALEGLAPAGLIARCRGG